MIVLEGPDGGGKSTLAEKIKEYMGWREVIHDGGPPKSLEEVMERLHRVAVGRRAAVYDRVTLLCEQIYGPIVRRTRYMEGEKQKQLVQVFLSHKPLIIYCRPPTEHLLDTEMAKKTYKNDAFMNSLRGHRGEIIRAYDELMCQVSRYAVVMTYNYLEDAYLTPIIFNSCKRHYLNEHSRYL